MDKHIFQDLSIFMLCAVAILSLASYAQGLNEYLANEFSNSNQVAQLVNIGNGGDPINVPSAEISGGITDLYERLDVNKDGKIVLYYPTAKDLISDYEILSYCWGVNVLNNGSICNLADVNSDGLVDEYDAEDYRAVSVFDKNRDGVVTISK